MKKLALSLLGLSLLAGLCSAPALAQGNKPTPSNQQGGDFNDDSDAAPEDGAKEKSKVAQALEKCGWVTDERPREAQVYFIIRGSMQNDGAMVKKLADIRKKSGRGKNVEIEIIYICLDRDYDETKDWMKDEKVKLPVMQADKVNTDLPWPYKQTNSDVHPMMVAMDGKGKKVDQACGGAVLNMVSKWKKTVRQYKAKKARAGKF
ncbi:MAG: hypothetical protein Q4F30_06495 [Akkermansia sp.]|nr:hypothetical protein [Akkermansia sp.]